MAAITQALGRYYNSLPERTGEAVMGSFVVSSVVTLGLGAIMIPGNPLILQGAVVGGIFAATASLLDACVVRPLFYRFNIARVDRTELVSDKVLRICVVWLITAGVLSFAFPVLWGVSLSTRLLEHIVAGGIVMTFCLSKAQNEARMYAAVVI